MNTNARCQGTGSAALKPRWLAQAIAAMVLPALGLVVVQAENFSIDWFKVAGGGGTSTNGQYALSGTVGQQDAGGPMTGSKFSLTGGFWGLISAVQTPGSPRLSILLTATNTVVVYWTFPSTGFALLQNSNATVTASWVAGPSPSNDGVHNFIVFNPPVGNRFYRLVHP